MNLLLGERVIVGSDKGGLMLTTHRVRYTATERGNSESTAIFLEDVVYMGIRLKRYRWMIPVGVVAALAGLAGVEYGGGLLLVLGLGLIIAYFVTRSQDLIFASAADRIAVRYSKMTPETATFLLDSAETAKNDRFLGRIPGTVGG